jgi:hypothetical protein
MATPIFKFNHPDLNEDLFFVYNTFHELPDTVPMDLTTFILYNIESGRLLEGLIYTWDQLILTGTSLEGFTFENFFDDEEKEKLVSDANDSFAIVSAQRNHFFSSCLREFLSAKKNTERSIFKFISQQKKNIYKYLKPPNYYFSRHYLVYYLFNKIEKIDFTENELIDLFLKYNFPLYFVPHRFRSKGFFRSECIRKNQAYLIPGFELLENKNCLDNLDRVDSLKFKIHKIDVNERIARIYLKQILDSSFDFSFDLNEAFSSLNKPLDLINLEEIKHLISTSTRVCFPESLYCFDKDIIELEKGNDEYLHYKVKLYSDIMTISYDQQGIISMECFGMQIYVLCDSYGNELTGYCHDLEIGPDGLIVCQASENNIGWKKYKYIHQYGINFFKEEIADTYDYWRGCQYFNGRDLHLLGNESIFNSNYAQISINIHSPEDVRNVLMEKKRIGVSTDSDFWYCAPWFVPFYNSFRDLAILGIKKDCRVFTLLSESSKADVEIIETFIANAFFEFALVSLGIDKLIFLASDKKQVCLNWLKDSGTVFSFMNPDFKKDKDFLLVLATHHPEKFAELPHDILANHELIKSCLAVSGEVLKYLPEELKCNRELVLTAVSNKPIVIEFACELIRGEREIIKNLFQKDCNTLKHALINLRSEKEFMIELLKINLEAFNYITDELKSNKEILNFYNNRNNNLNNEDLPF